MVNPLFIWCFPDGPQRLVLNPNVACCEASSCTEPKISTSKSKAFSKYSQCAQYLRHRPHRIRLLKEIRRRKRAREFANTGGRQKRGDAMANTRATNEATTFSTVHDEHAPAEEIATAQKSAPSAPQTNQTLETASPHHAKEKHHASKQELEAGQADRVTDSSSTSTACTPYEKVGSHARELSPLASECAATPLAVGDNVYPCTTDRNLGTEGEAPPSMRVEVSESLESREEGGRFVQRSDASAERRFKTSGMRGTLQMSGVRAGNINIALGGHDPFLQVKTCDQLRRTNAVAGKGENRREDVPWGNLCTCTTLSFT